MSAQTFAEFSKQAPKYIYTKHTDNSETKYVCHLAVIYWMFRELGESEDNAHKFTEMVNSNACLGCTTNYPRHGSIAPNPYGKQFCIGAAQIMSKVTLYPNVQLGDVLITGHPNEPNHSMVVVQKTNNFDTFVRVRGFNNTGTLGTGTRYEYDDRSRDIYVDKYWDNDQFGLWGSRNPIYCIPYNQYRHNAIAVRNLLKLELLQKGVFV